MAKQRIAVVVHAALIISAHCESEKLGKTQTIILSPVIGGSELLVTEGNIES